MALDLMSLRNPMVSWVICSNRSGQATMGAVKSCLDQTYSNFELIFVANGPNRSIIYNEVSEAFGSDPRLNIYQVETSHLPFSLSFGVEQAKGEWIARMDCDDICLPDRLETQINHISSNPDIDVLGTQFDWIDHEERISDGHRHPTSNKLIRRALFFENPICHPTAILKRSLILKHGGYLGGVHAEDYDLWTNLATDPSVHFENLATVGLLYRSRQDFHLARKSISAYTTVAAAQLKAYIRTRDIRWLISTLYTLVKTIFIRNNL